MDNNFDMNGVDIFNQRFKILHSTQLVVRTYWLDLFVFLLAVSVGNSLFICRASYQSSHLDFCRQLVSSLIGRQVSHNQIRNSHCRWRWKQISNTLQEASDTALSRENNEAISTLSSALQYILGDGSSMNSSQLSDNERGRKNK